MKPLAKPWSRNLAAIDTNVLVRLLTQDQPAIVDATRQWVAAKAGFVDCLNVALARAHGKDSMATFDMDAAKLPGAAKL